MQLPPCEQRALWHSPLIQQGRPQEVCVVAVGRYARSIGILNLGNALFGSGHKRDAVRCYMTVLRLMPNTDRASPTQPACRSCECVLSGPRDPTVGVLAVRALYR